jgi:diguanylate cyclase (GGDEF)-like protein/putative nucleotidyltransferase with HDIG domain
VTAAQAPARPWEGATARFAAVGLATVLLLLTAFASWTAIHTRSLTSAVTRRTALVTAYQQARFDIAEQESLVLRYEASPTPDARARVIAAGRGVTQGLQYVAHHGDPRDRRLARDLLRGTRVYMSAAEQIFGAFQSRQPVRARAIESEFEAVYPWVEGLILNAAKVNQARSATALQSLRSSEHFLLIATPVGFATGLILLALFSTILVRTRRRFDESRRLELERLANAARVDSLTGLANHRALHEDLARLLEDPPDQLVIVMFDLDGLKLTNDAQGHQAGDDLIQALAEALQQTTRRDDAVYRVGGDEFLAILPNATLPGAIAFTERVQSVARELGNGAEPTVTAGVAVAPRGVGRDVVLKRADLALIEAKRQRIPALVYSEALEALIAATAATTEERHMRTLATALARAVDAKDSNTRSHCETVSNLCGRIAEVLGLSAETTRKLRLAGLLHDVGKIGVADAILKKPGPLTAAEYDVMKTHAALGQSIALAAELNDEAVWILHHHERIDGMGYPGRLAGDEIPLESRIILVADAFEAMTADRPYRPARNAADALAEIEANAGSQFDEDCVEALRIVLSAQLAELGPTRPAAAAAAA